MNRTNKEIKERFDFFTKLLTIGKIVVNNTIRLEPKESNIRWLTGSTIVKHQTVNDDIIFFVERCKRDLKYGIKLRCTSLTNEPFFRFDSDGPAHRNDLPNVPLEQQSVTTPHFNSYKEDGKPIAYKNEALINEENAKEIASDINFGVSLFCMETNSKLSTGDFPTITDQAPELGFGNESNNNFDQIIFE